MSKADEMLKELGYEKITNDNSWLVYENNKEHSQLIFSYGEFCMTNSNNEALFINSKELKAINEKCKELKWID